VSGPWLAIDTATEVASVALGSPERVRAVRSVRGARQHAAQIVPLIDQVLTLAAVRVRNLAAVVVGDGPGSFTGLRIGWAAAKGVAQDTGIPLRAVPSLMGAAHAAARCQLLMGQSRAAVGRHVRPHLGLPLLKEGMQGRDIVLHQGQIDYQRWGIELRHRCTNGFEDGTFHACLHAPSRRMRS